MPQHDHLTDVEDIRIAVTVVLANTPNLATYTPYNSAAFFFR